MSNVFEKTGARVIPLRSSEQMQKLRQVRVFTTARALEIAMAETDVEMAEAALCPSDTDETRCTKLEIVISRLKKQLATVLR
jgi:hypothetical protein